MVCSQEVGLGSQAEPEAKQPWGGRGFGTGRGYGSGRGRGGHSLVWARPEGAGGVGACPHAPPPSRRHFEVPEDPKALGRLFSVPDFVGDACKALASRVRGAVAAVTFDDFHKVTSAAPLPHPTSVPTSTRLTPVPPLVPWVTPVPPLRVTSGLPASLMSPGGPGGPRTQRLICWASFGLDEAPCVP